MGEAQERQQARVRVTGGAGGLGSAIGRTLTSDGFQVVLAGRNLAAAQKVADDIGEGLGPRPHPGQVDVTNRESVATLVGDIDSGRVTSPLSESERLALVLGITCHAVYHAGQIQLLKRLVDR